MDDRRKEIIENESGMMFMMQLLMEEECELPEMEEVEKVMKKHLGDETGCADFGNDIIGITANKYKTEIDDAPASPILSIFKCTEFDSSHIDEMARTQMWDCPEHDEILSSCKFQILTTDMLGAGLYYSDRGEMLMDFMEALVELFPKCRAVYFTNSGKMFTAEAIRSHKIERKDRFVYFTVNVRFFRLRGTEDMLVDTVGMKPLFMPDLQYHFHGVDPNIVVNHAYMMLSYMYDNANPFESGHTVDGIADGKITPEIQWRCQYENSLIIPPREVIDINMGENASGERE